MNWKSIYSSTIQRLLINWDKYMQTYKNTDFKTLQQNDSWETTFTHSTNLESCFHMCEVLSDSVSVKASYLLVKRAHSSGLRARHSLYLCRASSKWPCFTRSLPSRLSRVKRASFLLAVGRHKELQHKEETVNGGGNAEQWSCCAAPILRRSEESFSRRQRLPRPWSIDPSAGPWVGTLLTDLLTN